MIQAVIFDLDGTLVQTEGLKALSYARAAVELCPSSLDENTVIEAFKDVVGLPRREVATTLAERFNLTDKAKTRMAEFNVNTPWQAYEQIRLKIYSELLADPDVIRSHQWPHNIALLGESCRSGYKVGLATMSYRPQVQRVLAILGLGDTFDFVATRDDVNHGKPSPEIYQLVAHELDVKPYQCLVIEDSPTGVQAALAAEMHVVAVSTPFTRKRLHESGLLPEPHIVDEPDRLHQIVADVIEGANQTKQSPGTVH